MLNVVKATFDALEQLKSPETEAAHRGKPVKDLMPLLGAEEEWLRKKKLKRNCASPGEKRHWLLEKHKATMRALGLHHMNQTVEQVDSPYSGAC